MRRKASRTKDKGTAQLEFAFSIFFMLVAILTMMELCNAVYTFVVLSEAANEGLRYAIVHSSQSGTDFSNGVKGKVWSYAGNAFSIQSPTTAVGVTLSCPDGGVGGCPGTLPGRVEVSVSYPYVPLINVFNTLGASSPTMTAYAEGRLVY